MSKESWLCNFDVMNIVNVLLPEYTLHIHFDDAEKLKIKDGHPLQLLSFTNKKSDKRAIVAIDNVFGSIILQKKEQKQQRWETVAYDIVTADSINEKIRKHYDKQDRGINIRTLSSPYTAISHNGSCVAEAVKVFFAICRCG
jgi:predicted DNA binding CopG/RHH family protein